MRYILNYYFRNWGKNPSATTAQREEFGEAKLKHERWGYDHENCLRLIGEGFDGKPMGSAKWSVARRYFGNIENLLKNSSNEEQQTFWIKKCQWTEIRRDIGDKLLTREAIRLRQHNINIGWLSLFGELFKKVMEIQFRCAHLERCIAIRETDPSITEEEINKLVEEAIKQGKKEMEKLQDQLIQARLLALFGPQGTGGSPEDVKNMKKR